MKTILIYFLISILCYFISGIIHELGHIIVGLVNGWKFHLLVIGPLGIKSDVNGRIKFYFEKKIAMWGGFGCIAPQDFSTNNIKIWSNVLIGGPLASIIFGILFVSLGIFTMKFFLILLGAISLSMGVICILPIPLKTGITYSDGGRWSRLHRGGQEADEEIALFKLAENEITNDNFSKIDSKNIQSLIQSKNIDIGYLGYYYSFKYYKSKNNKKEMKRSIEKMKEMEDEVSSIIFANYKIDFY